MTRSIMEDAFAHHVWASMRTIDACLELTPEQLDTQVPGTYGSIMETIRHLVGSDAWYLFTLTGDRDRLVDELIEQDHVDLGELRSRMERHGARWSKLLEQGPDPDAMLEEVDDEDGYRKDAPIGIRLAQALHHGTDHRSQICTALTTLGVDPPGVDVWDFGIEGGRVTETYPPV